MTTWNIYKPTIIWRIQNGRYPTLYIAKAEDENPLKIKKMVKIPVPPAFAREETETQRMVEEAAKSL